MTQTWIEKDQKWVDNAAFKVGDYYPCYITPENARYNIILAIEPYTGLYKDWFRFVFTFPLNNGEQGQIAIA